jgi:hypothetical protein
MSVAHPAACDLFNGDADGICALHQLRMAEPRRTRLITGVKRDIELFRHLPPDRPLDVTVLDLCFDKNEAGVRRVLQADGQVRYFDHHSAHTLFEHPRLHACIDQAADVCTSLLVDRHLAGRFRDWAIVGAHGDNLSPASFAMARARGHDAGEMEALQRLGLLLNYNAYGESTDDLHLPPLQLYEAVRRFESPFDFIAQADEYRRLAQGYEDDRHRSAALQPFWRHRDAELYLLPGEAWARRLSGTLANRLVAEGEGKSVAVLTRRSDGHFIVSVRIAARCAASADALCRRYPSGGGRRAAAGIDSLPESELEGFIAEFSRHTQGAQ